MLSQRTCIGCCQKNNQDKMLRIVKNKKLEILIETDSKIFGRGAYICKSEECLEKAIKNRRLSKSFKMQIEDEIYEKLRGAIIE